MENSKLINGDCLEELKKIDDDTVDLLCTDPPYGYGFMGKHWDTFQEKQSTKSQSVGWMSPGMTKSTYGMREFFIPIWKEALRVVKPGGFALVMSAPRSDVQTVMVQTLQEAGFDVSFTPIYWTYATGFPKALNIGKSVTKRGDIDEAKKLDGSYAGYQPKPAVEVVIVAMKPLGKKMGYVDQALDNGKGVTWLDDCRIPFAEDSSVEDKRLVEGGSWDTSKMGENIYSGGWAGKRVSSQKKKLSDKEQYDKDNVAGHKKFIEKEKDEMYGGGWDKPSRKSKSDYEKYVEKQKSFKGAKTIGKVKEGGTSFLSGDLKQLDPSETYQDELKNYSEERGWDKWGEEDTYERVSAFGDSSQSETKDGRNLWGKKATKKVKVTKRKPREEGTVFKTSGFKSEKNDVAEASPLGRFAANLLISDNILDDGKSYSHGTGGPYVYSDREYEVEGFIKDIKPTAPSNYGDSGDFNRYFSLDAWWRDRFKRLPEEIQRTFPFLIVPKASKREKNMGLDKFDKQQKIFNGQSDKPSTDMKGVEQKFTTQPSANNHPTVKPIDLMSYLVILGSRKDDVVLDPFAGSGTTGIACVFSERNYILIEREKEYYDIMEARIKKAKNPADLVQHEWF